MNNNQVYRPAGLLRKVLASICAVTLVLQSTAALAADITTYTYDEARPEKANVGHLTSVSNSAGTIRYDHDESGNVTSQRWEVDGSVFEQTFVYALHGQVLRRGFADGAVFPSATGNYQYDGRGNLKSIPGLVNNITYNAALEPVSTTYANGVTETRTYDPNRQFLMSITAASGSTTLFSEDYSRNNKGLITEVASNRPNGDWKYGYDTADRLKSSTNLNDALLSQTFRYDAADNITYNSAVGNYSYPAPTAPRPHAVTSAGGNSYTYDANGNMLSGAGRTIVYDGENRPISITMGGQTTAFVYGPDGKRLKKITGGETTLYLGADEEITPDGTHIKHPIKDVRIAGNQINWLHRDHLSSVKLMSNASGAIISENLYKPYGERSDVQVAVGVPRESKGWIGERDDPETGLKFLNARYYDPELARFVSPDWFDPRDPRVGTNRYTYGLNNPIALKDPSGNAVCFGACIAGGVAAAAWAYRLYRAYRLVAPVVVMASRAGGAGIGHNGGPKFTPEEEAEHKSPSEPPNPNPNGSGFVAGAAASIGSQVASTDNTTDQTADGLTKPQRDAIAKIDRRISHTLNERHFQAVRIEREGGVVQYKADGTPFNHIQEVIEARDGQLNAIENLKTALGSPSLDPDAVPTILEAIGKASRSVDQANRALKGGETQFSHDKTNDRDFFWDSSIRN